MKPAAADAAPSIRARLSNALTVWAAVLVCAVSLVVWLSAMHEMDELLDDMLEAASAMTAPLVQEQDTRKLPLILAAPADGRRERFAWQVVAGDGTLLLRSAQAPTQPWHGIAAAEGFSDRLAWRVYGAPLGTDGRMLYVGQSEDERVQESAEVALGAALATLAVGLLGLLWLRLRTRQELEPLARLSARLDALDQSAIAPTGIGAAERLELQPVHRAIDDLTARLAARLANEQAFVAHAAHALRTPLAGIDAQLAVALRECPPDMRERLQNVRGAATRLQSVVAALLGLFRAGRQALPEAIDVAALLARMPLPQLLLTVAPGTQVHADADLLAAALLNLLDNAQRHGAARVWIEPLPGAGLRIRDDGPGVPPARRAQLQAALDAQAYDSATGLGLMLADRVARAHGGRLRLAPAEAGFVVDLQLGGTGAG